MTSSLSFSIEQTSEFFANGDLMFVKLQTGDIDNCGHRPTVWVDAPARGNVGYAIQANFNDFHESRSTYEEALGAAYLLIASVGKA